MDDDNDDTDGSCSCRCPWTTATAAAGAHGRRRQQWQLQDHAATTIMQRGRGRRGKTSMTRRTRRTRGRGTQGKPPIFFIFKLPNYSYRCKTHGKGGYPFPCRSDFDVMRRGYPLHVVSFPFSRRQGYPSLCHRKWERYAMGRDLPLPILLV